MFGIAIARLDSLSEAERERYQALYCGLCVALRKRYGQISRVTLSYELTFLAMLYDSLYEPTEQTGRARCIAHPKRPVAFVMTDASDYCADLSVALAYHKCLDDVSDEKSLRSRASEAALRRAYRKAAARIPEHATVIAETMELIRALEADPHTPPDATSIAFGEMLGFLFECVPGRYPDRWSSTLREFGYWLGRFVLLMDAAIDLEDDRKSGAYNPLLRMSPVPGDDDRRAMLGDLIGRASVAYERLPLVQDANLMNSVIYAGVWQKLNHLRETSRAQGHPPRQGTRSVE